MQLQVINQGLVFTGFIYLLFSPSFFISSSSLSPLIFMFFLATPEIFANFHSEYNESFNTPAMNLDTARNTSFQQIQEQVIRL